MQAAGIISVIKINREIAKWERIFQALFRTHLKNASHAQWLRCDSV